VGIDDGEEQHKPKRLYKALLGDALRNVEVGRELQILALETPCCP
jgi:hypothetical protein